MAQTDAFIINPTKPTIPDQQINSSLDKLSNWIIALLAILIPTMLIKPIALVTKVIKYFSPDSKGQQADLYLKIFNQTTTAMIKLTTIPLDHKIIYTDIPTLQDFSVNFNKIWPSIKLSWNNDLEFKFNDKVDEIHLPTLISAPLKSSLDVHSIKTSHHLKFYALLFVPYQENRFYYFDQLNKYKIYIDFLYCTILIKNLLHFRLLQLKYDFLYNIITNNTVPVYKYPIQNVMSTIHHLYLTNIHFSIPLIMHLSKITACKIHYSKLQHANLFYHTSANAVY